MLSRTVQFDPMTGDYVSTWFWSDEAKRWIGWLVCALLAIGVCVWAASGCVAPQYHLHLGEKHYHQQATESPAEGEPQTDSDKLMGLYFEGEAKGGKKAAY